jgi:hypothetical protein
LREIMWSIYETRWFRILENKNFESPS